MRRRPTPAHLAALALVLLIALTTLPGCGGDGVSLEPGETKVVSVGELEDFADGAGHDVYWAGERPDTELELSETEGGRIFVRYLPAGGGGGDEFLTVGTYPVEDGAAALRRAARNGEGKEIARSDEGAVVLIDRKAPDNAHLAYPGEDLQIEVFSPVSGEALKLAARDGVEPVP
jgi:hypothetical protein